MKNTIWKRVLSILIVFSVLPFGSFAFASEIYTQRDIEIFNENVSLLYDFNLIENDNKEMATTVSRSEFASVMVKYLQFGNETRFSGEGNERLFSDVTENADDIYSAVALGIMSGYPGGRFGPENNILLEEALKALVSALGWGEIAQSMGGYPAGYAKAARNLELTEGVNRGQGAIITYFDLVQLLVNALSAENYLGDNIYNEPQSWLSSVFKVDRKRGKVTHFEQSINQIIIDDVIYDCDKDCTDLLGCRVEFYVDEEDKITHIHDFSRERLEFDASLIDDYSSKTYSIYKDEDSSRPRNYRLAQDAHIIYNGNVPQNLSVGDMVPEFGRIILISNDGNSRYDTVLIEDYEIYSVVNVDNEDDSILCKGTDGKTSTISVDTDEVRILSASGNPLTLEDIESKSVLRVARSVDGQNIKIIVSDKVVTGSISSIADDDDYIKVEIDGAEYKTVAAFSDSSKIKPGLSGIFYLDSEDLIVSIKTQETGWQYGYLMRGYFDDSFDEKLVLKIYTGNDEAVTLECREKLIIDGTSGIRSNDAVTILKDGNSEIKKQMIRYKLNDKGLIIEIDTPYNSVENMEAGPKDGEDKDSLRVVWAKTNAHYSKALYSFEGKINVSRTTPIFNIPGDDEEKFRISSVSALQNDKKYDIVAYADSENSVSPCFIYMAKSLGASGDDTVGLISRVVTAIDPEEEIATLFTVEIYSGCKEYYYKPEKGESAVEIEEGDIISFKYEDEYADSIKVIYDYGTKTCPNGNTSGGFGTSQLHYIFGNVYSKIDDHISVTTADILNGVTPTSDQLENIYASVFKILKYEDGGRRAYVTKATTEDIVDYENGGAGCSKVFVATDWQWPRIIVIY